MKNSETSFFYQPELATGQAFLEGEEYQHCVKVLRKNAGDLVGILDGKGKSYIVKITEITGKKCNFSIENERNFEVKPFYNHIAIAPTKSPDRIEWFVEKACELGVDEISFIYTQNSERNKLKTERLEKKAISALKQSRSGFLTKINPLQKFGEFLKDLTSDVSKYIAVVEDNLPYYLAALPENSQVITLIGPEGDFSESEIKGALANGFEKVSLGRNTLRTETAGIVAAHLINAKNGY